MGNTATVTQQSVDTEFIEKAKTGEVERMKELLDKGVMSGSMKSNVFMANVNACDKDGQTALMWAAAMGHSLCVKLCAENGGFLEARCSEGYTALHYAVVEKRMRTVKQLVKTYKCDVNCLTNEKHTPLHKASRYGSIEIAQLLINNGASMNSKDIRGRTPLDLARNSEYRQFLIKLGGETGLSTGVGDGMEGKPSTGSALTDAGVPVTMLGASASGAIESDEKVAQQSSVFSMSDGVAHPPSAVAMAGEASGAEMEKRKRNEMAAEVERWLQTLLLSEYTDNFLDNGYDRIDAVIEMEREDLTEIDIKKGHIRLLLKSIQELKESKQKTLSFVAEFAKKSDSEEHAKDAAIEHVDDASILDEPGQGGDEKEDQEKEEEEVNSEEIDDGIKEMEVKNEEEEKELSVSESG